MFRKRSDDELWRLQQELIAAEEDEEDEEYDDPDNWEYDEEYDEEYDDDGEDFEEEEPVRPGHMTRYRRGHPKKFKDRHFFDRSIGDDEDVLYRKDYKKAKRRRRRKALGLMILAVLELIAIGALILWFMSWM